MPEYRFIENFIDLEDTLVREIKKYFNEQIKMNEIFTKYGKVNVTETHPFAIVLAALDNGGKVPGNIFPSISVAAIDDSPGSQVLNLESEVVEIDEEWLTEQESNDLVNQNQVAELKAYIQANPDKPVFGVGYTDRYISRLAYTIWTENRRIRSFLYHHIRSFIFLNQDLFGDMYFENWTLDGNPAGDYNHDFGRILYGSQVDQVGERRQFSVLVNTDWTAISEVELYIDDINSSE